MRRFRTLGGLGAALVLLGTASVAGSPARAASEVDVSPNPADPGATVTARSATGRPCPGGTDHVEVFVFEGARPVGAGSSTSVAADGTWIATIRLPPRTSPGRYTVRAQCLRGDSPQQREALAEYAAELAVRLQEPGRPEVRPEAGSPGHELHVSSGAAACTRPVGAPDPEVRVVLIDRGGTVRATNVALLGPGDRWSVSLRLPPIPAQEARIGASCWVAAAPAPYARYADVPVSVLATAVPTTQPAPPGGPTSMPGPGGSDPPLPSVPTTAPIPGVDADALPPTRPARPIVAEPTYTG